MAISNPELDELRQKQAAKLQALKQQYRELETVEEERANAMQGFSDQAKAIRKEIKRLVNEDDAQFIFEFAQ